MRPISPLLALALLLQVACGGGDGGGTRTALPGELRLVKVSGDGQRAPVASTSPAASRSDFRVSVSSAQGELLPEALVASIVVQGPAANRMGLPTGSSVRVDKLPAGTTVEFGAGVAGVPGDNPRCGAPFIRTVLPGDSAKAVNRWSKGTLAGTCVMRTRLLVGSEPMQSDSFTAVFTAGPAAQSEAIAGQAPLRVPTGRFLTDKHGNPTQFRLEVLDSTVRRVDFRAGQPGDYALPATSAAIRITGDSARVIEIRHPAVPGWTGPGGTYNYEILHYARARVVSADGQFVRDLCVSWTSNAPQPGSAAQLNVRVRSLSEACYQVN